MFGFTVGRRQWMGVGLTALGLVLLAVTLPSTSGSHSTYSGAMIAFEAGLLHRRRCWSWARLGARHEHHGVLLGMASGILFGVSDVAIKALTGIMGTHGALGLSPWLAMRRRLGDRLLRLRPRPPGRGGGARHHGHRRGREHPGIAGGILVFGDPMPGDPLGIVVQASPS